MIVNKYNTGGGGGGYTLPTATASRLGGVKIGSGITVQNDGTISVSGGTPGSGDVVLLWSEITAMTDEQRAALVESISATTLDTNVWIRTNDMIAPLSERNASNLTFNGYYKGNAYRRLVLNSSGTYGSAGYNIYELPAATDQVLGGVKVGQGLSIDSGGTLSATGGGGGNMTQLAPVSMLPSSAETGTVFAFEGEPETVGYWEGYNSFHITDTGNTAGASQIHLQTFNVDDGPHYVGILWNTDHWEVVESTDFDLSNNVQGRQALSLAVGEEDELEINLEYGDYGAIMSIIATGPNPEYEVYEAVIDIYGPYAITEDDNYILMLHDRFNGIRNSVFQYNGNGWDRLVKNRNFYLYRIMEGQTYEDLANFLFQYYNGLSDEVSEYYPIDTTHIYVYMGQDFKGAFDNPGFKGWVEVFPSKFENTEEGVACFLTGNFSIGGEGDNLVYSFRIGILENGSGWNAYVDKGWQAELPESQFAHFTSGGTMVNTDAYDFARGCGADNNCSEYAIGQNGIIIVDDNDYDTTIGYGNIVGSRPLSSADYADLEFGFKIIFEFMVGSNLYRAVGDIVSGGNDEGWHLGSISQVV